MDGDMATPRQLTAIAAGFGEHGATQREVRLAVISRWVGVPITTMKDLARVEASYVIDFLKREAESGELAVTIAAARASVQAVA